MKKVALVGIGNELLVGTCEDSNGNWLNQQLSSLGIKVTCRTIIGESKSDLAAVLREASQLASVVILTGGIRGQVTDVTRRAVAAYCGISLQESPFVTEISGKPGTTPGLLINHAGCLIVLLPGVLDEIQMMFLDSLKPVLLMDSPVTSTLPDEVSLATLGEDPRTLAHSVIALARQFSGGCRLATAESCTGGLVSHLLTSVPGSSAAFAGGVVAYSNEIKESLLDVPRETMVEHGAVSEWTAKAMAVGARRRLLADFAVSVTGIAGPDGGTIAKPVGTVCIGMASPRGVEAWTIRLGEHLTREEIQGRSAHLALYRLFQSLRG